MSLSTSWHCHGAGDDAPSANVTHTLSRELRRAASGSVEVGHGDAEWEEGQTSPQPSLDEEEEERNDVEALEGEEPGVDDGEEEVEARASLTGGAVKSPTLLPSAPAVEAGC